MPLFRKPKHFFQYFVQRSVDEIYYSVGLRRFGVQLIGLYEPIYLYTFFNKNISFVLFFFAAILLGHSLLAPLGGRLMAKIGTKRSMLVSIPFLITYYLLFFFSEKVFFLIFLAPIAAMISRVTFLPAFHADFAKLSTKKNRGKQLGIMNIITLLGSVIGPLLGAFVLVKYGFSVLFIIIAILFFLSAIPLMTTLKTKPRYRDSYQSAWKLVAKKGWRKKSVSLMLYGAESGVNLTYWPLFLFILAISYSELGAISSISLVFSLAIILYSSRLTDRVDKIKVFRSGCFIASLGNLLKVFVWNPVSAVITQIFFRIGDTLDTTPLTAYIYDKTQKEKLSVGRFIVFREIVQNMGTALVYIIGGIVFLFVSQEYIYLFFIVSSLSVFFAGILAKSFNENFITNLENIKKKANEHINIKIEQESK